MKNKKPRFTIGTKVTVSATVECVYVYEDKDVSRVPFENRKTVRVLDRKPCKPFTGWIVGARKKHLGEYSPRTWSYDGEEDPAYLSIDKVVWVWLVRVGIVNKEVEVLDEDLQPTENYDWPPTVPWMVVHREPIPDGVRAIMKQEAKEAKRDSNGRFIKKPRVIQ